MKIKCLNWHKTLFPLTFRISGYDQNISKCTVHVFGFENEIFVEISEKNFNENDLQIFITFLENNSVFVNNSRCSLVKKFTLYGFLPIYCYKIYITRGILKKNLSGPFYYKTLNDDVDERVKFATERHIHMCKWIEIKEYEKVIRDDFLIYNCKWDQLYPVQEEDPVYDLEISCKIMYFDIECEELKNDEDEDEENSYISSDNITQISIVCEQHKLVNIYLLSIFQLDENNVTPEGYEKFPVKVIVCKTQKKLLLSFFEILSLEDPDIISGYNILEFDWKRIISISQKVEISETIYKKYISRSKTTTVKWISKTWESTAYAKKEFFYPEIEGRSNLDIIQHVKRNYRLSSYSLNNVVKTFLVEKSKLDVDYKIIKIVSKLSRECYDNFDIKELKKKIEELNPYRFYGVIDKLVEELTASKTVDQFKQCLIYPNTVIGKYCIVDSLLCLELMDKLQILPACEEMANCTYVTLEDTLCRGNQYRIFNLLYNECYFHDIVLNKPEGKFEKMNNELRGLLSGALVLEPVCGHHRGVITLDFASLYPNVIINYNLCYTTLCFTKTITSRTIKTREGDYHFESVREGILPKLEKRLIEQRKLVKQNLKNETISFKRQILDSRQNALKITANSMYGSLAAEGGRRLLIPAAACITSLGRELLENVRKCVTNKGFEVIYGDTDSNIIKLPTSLYPFVNHDSRICKEHLEQRLTEKRIKYTSKGTNLGFESKDIEMISAFLAEEYSLDLDNKTTIDISYKLEQRAVNIGKELAKTVTDFINHEKNTHFELEYENCFEHYLLIGKKYYVGKTYSNKLIKKGVLSVKRVYSDIEKRIYDSTITSIFNKDSFSAIIEDLVYEIQKVFTDSSLYEYIITTSFKSLRYYASKIDTSIYIDKDGKRFVTRDKLHQDMHFTKLPVNAMVALKMYNRGDLCPENTRIEYVFYKTPGDKLSKGEMAIDFVYFYRNKDFLRINKLAYLKRIVNPIEKIIQISNLTSQTTSIYFIHEELARYFGIKIPQLSDIISIRTETRKYALSEIETLMSNLNVTYSCLENPVELEKLIKQRVTAKISVSISKKCVESLEKKLIEECRRVLNSKEEHVDFIISLCSTLNSRHVIDCLYKKYKLKSVRRKKRGIYSQIIDICEIKEAVIEELNNAISLFRISE